MTGYVNLQSTPPSAAVTLIFLNFYLVSTKAESDTGLEFLKDSLKLKFDKDFFLRKDAFSEDRLSGTSALEIVQMFIRNVKGLPREKVAAEQDANISENMKNHEGKPVWAFFPYRLAKLAKIEMKIYNVLKEFYSDRKLEPTALLESYFRDIEKSSILVTSNLVEIQKVDGVDDPYMYISTHPILVYRMIRRFAEDYQSILSQLKTLSGPEHIVDFLDLLGKIHGANPDLEIFPTNEDLDDALKSLLRIQEGHNLKTTEFAKGIFGDIDTQLGLNALHCLEVGTFMIKQQKYDYALQWLYFSGEIILKSIKSHEGVKIIYDFYSNVFSYAVNEHNRKWPIMNSIKDRPGVFTEVVNGTSVPSYSRKHDELEMEARDFRMRSNSSFNWATRVNFATVCSGVNLQSKEEKQKLACSYSHSSHPYWLINPLKVELLNADPPVVQIYNFLGEKFMKALKKDASDGLRRSQVVDGPSDTVKVSFSRTSVQTWLYDTDVKLEYLKQFSIKLEFLSGLNVLKEGASDGYQVAAYGTSQHYAPHVDSFKDSERTELKGNRILTFMGYLSDVAVGGRTGFPVLGISAEPVKGSIVMWESMMGDMIERDMRTYHGGCPVVLGVKWITNKWIYSKENMFKYPCPVSLHP